MIGVVRRVGVRALAVLACGLVAGLAACNLLTGAADLDIAEEAGDGGALDGAPGDGASGADVRDESKTDADVPVDAGPRCDRRKPFGTAALVPGLGTPAVEFAVSLTPDEKTAYVASSRMPLMGFDLYVATRSGPDAPFGTAKRIDELSTANDDRHPTISADGKTLVFLRLLPTTANDLFLATKTATGTFGDAASLPVNSAGEDTDPFLMPDGKTLYFHSTAGVGGGTLRLYVSTLDLGGTWSSPQLVRGLEAVTASDATLTDDELEMFVRVGTQIHYTSRETKSADFAAPVPVPELASATSEQPDWVSPDGCRLYFTSSRDGGAGGNDIWFAQRGK